MGNRVEKLRLVAVEELDRIEVEPNPYGSWQKYEKSPAWREFNRVKYTYTVTFKGQFRTREQAEAYIASIEALPGYFLTHKTLRSIERGGQYRPIRYFVTLHGYEKNDETWEEGEE